MTVFMAAFVLGERIRGIQRVGVVVAVVAVIMISAGG